MVILEFASITLNRMGALTFTLIVRALITTILSGSVSNVTRMICNIYISFFQLYGMIILWFTIFYLRQSGYSHHETVSLEVTD